MIQKNKKTQSHIEMILSFIIFIGFLIGILFFVNPLKNNNMGYPDLDDAQEKLINNLSITYWYIPLIANTSLPPSISCFYVRDLVNINESLLVLDQAGKSVKTSRESGKIILEKSFDERFYTLYFSDNFKEKNLSNTHSCIELPEENYSFGALGSEEIIFYENILALNSSYMEDYASLKTSLNLKDDFNFIVYNQDKIILMNDTLEKNKVTSRKLLSREIPLKMIDKFGNQTNIVFNLRIW